MIKDGNRNEAEMAATLEEKRKRLKAWNQATAACCVVVLASFACMKNLETKWAGISGVVALVFLFAGIYCGNKAHEAQNEVY